MEDRVQNRRDAPRVTSRRFLTTLAWVLPVWVLLYALCFRFCIVRDPTVVPVSYKQLLLEHVEGPRILIEGGSNGLHAFDPHLVEQLTGYPTLILSDHAGASLSDKVQRLRRYAHPGDIVLLPLEWNYYHAPDLNENHLRSLMDRGRSYYYSLPLWQQLRRAFAMPLSVVASEGIHAVKQQSETYADEMQRLQLFENHWVQRAPNGQAVLGPNLERLPEDSDCDGYILPEFEGGPIPFTQAFEGSLRQLARLQREKGLTVVLLPPVVVGANCYERNGAHLEVMLEQVRRLCVELELRHLFDFHRYAMPSEFLLDTHFHVTAEGSEVVTPLVMGDLVEAGWIVPRPRNEAHRVVDQIPRILESLRMDLLRRKLPLWQGNPTTVVDGGIREQFYFGDDWHDPEPWGRWVRVSPARVIVRPDPELEYKGVYLNAQYFNGSQQTRVWLNGHRIAEQDFTQNHRIELEKPLHEFLDGEPLAVFTFESSEAVSPFQIEGSSDKRQLKFGLHSLELLRE